MATINFQIIGTLKKSKDKKPVKGWDKSRDYDYNNPSNIYVRFRHGRNIDQKAKTGLVVNPEYWSHSRQQVKMLAKVAEKDALNNSLKSLTTAITTAFNTDYSEGVDIDKIWLDAVIDRHFGRVVKGEEKEFKFFIDFIDRFIEEASTRIIKKTNRPVSVTTIKHYKKNRNRLIKFETFRGRRIRFKELGLSFHSEYLTFLSTIQLYNPNTCGEAIKKLHKFAVEAQRVGYPVSEEIDHPDFFKPSNKALDPYLNIAEIDLIYNLDLSSDLGLEVARDHFIIGLWIGQRVSDFLKFRGLDNWFDKYKSDKYNSDKDDFIELTAQKTGNTVVIPLHQQVKETAIKHAGRLPNISDTEFNEAIKEITRKAGLVQVVSGAKFNPETGRKESGEFPKNELVSSHICRRSFATNHYGKLPNQTIMSITGHKSEKSFLDYVKITPDEHAREMLQYWIKNNQEGLKASMVVAS